MSNRSEIARIARRVNGCLSEIHRKKESSARDAYNVNTWWQGEPSDAFIKEYQEIDSEISKTCRVMTELEQRVKTLANQVQRADEERRRKAEAKQKQKA